MEIAERGKHVFFDLGIIGEIPRTFIRQDFRYGTVVSVGHLFRIEEDESLLHFWITSQGGFRPGVFLGDMVDHVVDANPDVFFSQRIQQCDEIVHRPQARIDPTIVFDGISAVVFPVAGFEQRHQMEIGDSEFLEIVDLLDHLLQITREQIDIQGHPDAVLAEVSVGVRFIQSSQVFLAPASRIFHQSEKLFERLYGTYIRAVDFRVELTDQFYPIHG